MTPQLLCDISSKGETYMSLDYARHLIKALNTGGYAITKLRKLGRFEFVIYFDHQMLDGATGFTTPAGAWAYVRDELGAQLYELSQLKQMGYSVKRVKKVGF